MTTLPPVSQALTTSVQVWPAGAIQDTVAAIISQRRYQRSVRTTLLDRLYEWAADLIRRIFSEIAEIPNAKWIILAAAVLMVIALGLRFWLGGEAVARRRHGRSDMVIGGGDPWAEAERLAKTGEYTEAAHLLYRGVIERLAAAEQIRVHPSKTSGDYARDLLLKGSPAHNEFRQFGRRYDRVLFDLGRCDADTYVVLRDQATTVIRLLQRQGRAA